MKREYQSVDSIYHIFNKSARGIPYLYDNEDWWIILRLLYYLNDEYKNASWSRELWEDKLNIFERPIGWPERNPLIEIIDFCLHSNHYHLLIRQIKEDGILNFMRRFPNSVSRRHNLIHGGTGSVFQGPYQIRKIESNSDLYNTGMYVRVKNLFERYPKGGIEGAKYNFDDAYNWALKDEFSSFADYFGNRNSPILEKSFMEENFKDLNKNELKKIVREYLNNYEKIITEDYLFL